MSKSLPIIKTDEDAEALLEQDLSEYINKDNFYPVQFEYLPKTAQVNLRMSEPLLQAIKAQAAKQGIGYQKYIRQALEQSLAR